MNLSDKQLTSSSTVFHGIVPGKSAYPMGRISLEVAFGSEDNWRSEFLSFEVVKLKSPYHALFGRPAYAWFMAWPCYVYLKMKMPGPRGTIIVEGNRKIALSARKEMQHTPRRLALRKNCGIIRTMLTRQTGPP